jgi:hypothetical protein
MAALTGDGMRRIEGEQPEVCEQCGGEAFRPATRREQLGRWYTHGAGAGTAWYCRSCSASWSERSSYHALYRASASGWRRWVRLPFEVLAAVRHARSWHPVPVFYAAVGGVALVPATVVAVLTRVRWWVAIAGVPVAAMVAAFVWSLATAAGRRRRDVLWRLAPQRAWQQDLEEELAGMREQIGGFELLVPEGWPGTLSLEGASWSIPPRGPRVLHDVRVIADQGDPQLDPGRHTPGWRPSTPRVEIHSTTGAWPTSQDQALREFVERALPAPPPDLDDIDRERRREMERRMLAALRTTNSETGAWRRSWPAAGATARYRSTGWPARIHSSTSSSADGDRPSPGRTGDRSTGGKDATCPGNGTRRRHALTANRPNEETRPATRALVTGGRGRSRGRGRRPTVPRR